MKSVSIADGKAEFRALVSEGEPLPLTDGSQPVAVLIHVPGAAAQGEPGERQVRVVPLKAVLSDDALRASVGDDAVCVISVPATAASAGRKRDWWTALQTIAAGQAGRGFTGSVVDFDRGDQGYEERIDEIYKQTTPRHGPR